MTTRQLISGVLVMAAACCLIMWWLEGFRQRKWLEQLRSELATIPTYLGGTEAS